MSTYLEHMTKIRLLSLFVRYLAQDVLPFSEEHERCISSFPARRLSTHLELEILEEFPSPRYWL